MGKEMRRVPSDWEHPMDDKGRHQPLYDEDYDTACEKWLARLREWEAGSQERKDAEEKGCRYLWDWDESPPSRAWYRARKWTVAEATHYQIYENVSEGTPVSPIFASPDEMVEWLANQGFSRKASEKFAETGYAPSLIITMGQNGMQHVSGIGIHSLDE